MYPNVQMFIAGTWRAASSGATFPVLNPATGETLGTVPHATTADLDEALEAARTGFMVWRAVPPFERSRILRRAGDILRSKAAEHGRIMTLEQGKPLPEATMEVNTSADIFDWFAEEARRIYGRIIPSRSAAIGHRVEMEPVGPVAAFTPWNFPMSQPARKIAGALAAGCSIILKAAEETPASCAALAAALDAAGLPPGVFNLVFGVPAQISEYLIPHPVIRKISFTGSTVVGKHLAGLAGQHMKRVTMELGGHAPVVIFKDADIERSGHILARAKVRNAGQVCVSPTRFLVEDEIYDRFLDRFTAEMGEIKVGDGLDEGVMMGPLANSRRIDAMESLIADAVQHGATVRTGGNRIGNKGNFFEPTIVADVPLSARAMHEEPFGPVALVTRFQGYDDVIAEANRLPFGLSAYVYSGSAELADRAAMAIESGMVSINHQGLGAIETPFGGVKDSGYGSEGGSEAIQAYLVPKFIARAY